MNKDFYEEMKYIMGEEVDEFINLLNEKPYEGIRVNTNRISVNDFINNYNFDITKSPFATNGFYINKSLGLGYSEEHMLNLFYIQEPSASAAVTILNPKKNSLVLDICASPGSKSTQILEMLDNTGLLVCNETINSRVNALKENINKYACNNVVIINDDTTNIANNLEGIFDYVLCDAPCSGEGMFRKNEEAIKQWSLKYVKKCKELQEVIIENAFKCLKKDGILVYSTCTFNKYENEELIKEFLDRHPDAKLMDINVNFGRKSLPIGNYGYGLRITPMDKGEGHFIAKIKRTNGPINQLKQIKQNIISKEALEFINNTINNKDFYLYENNKKVYYGLNPFYDINLHLIQNQTYVGEIKKNRLEVSHEFLSSNYLKYKNIIDIDDNDLKAYYHGDILNKIYPKGWYVLRYNGIIVGGVKSYGSCLKNHYPKKLRKNY